MSDRGISVNVAPEDIQTAKADNRGRVNLGSEYGDAELHVAVLGRVDGAADAGDTSLAEQVREEAKAAQAAGWHDAAEDMERAAALIEGDADAEKVAITDEEEERAECPNGCGPLAVMARDDAAGSLGEVECPECGYVGGTVP